MGGRSTVGVLSRWTIALLLLVGAANLSQAAYDPTRTLIVDPQASSDEDVDGDRRFRSLSAALDPQNASHAQPDDTVVLKAGTYTESVTIDVPGLTVRSQGGRTKTSVVGHLTIQAKHVTLQGMSVEATGQAYGIAVNAPDSALEGLRVFGASAAGIRLLHARSATLKDVQLDNNALGLEASYSKGLSISSSQFQANEGAGARLSSLASASLSQNRFSLNGDAGLVWEQVTQSRLQNNRFSSNASDGLRVTHSAHNEVGANRFEHNGRYGAALERSVQVALRDNRFLGNGGKRAPSGGLLLDSAQDNLVEANAFQGHSDRQASGLHLLADASSNRVLNNQFDSNQVGILLERNGGGVPQTNAISDNRISASHGAGILSQGRNDRFVNNVLEGNNGPGVLLQNSEGERLERNTLFGNGKAGVYAQDSDQIQLVNNAIYDNAYGVWAQRVNDGTLQDNLVRNNRAQGVNITNSDGWKIVANRVLYNREDGLWLEDVSQLTFSGNTVERNLKNGAQLENAVDVDLSHNAFGNNDGGLAVWGGERVVVQFNDFDQNAAFGLWSMETAGLDARYNFWGGAEGPNGPSPARSSDNDVVKGVALEALFPWMPQRVAPLEAPAIKGWFFAQNPESASLRHAPRAKVAFGFSKLEAQNGWLSVMASKAYPKGAPTLGQAYQLFDTFTGGRVSGQVRLVVPYNVDALSPQTPLDDLGLFLWDGTQWSTLPSTLDTKNHALNAWVDVDKLDRATVALAWPQRRKLTSSAWLLSHAQWIVGEPFEARLRDPDKNAHLEQPDRLLGAVELLDSAGTTLLSLDAQEDAAASGEFLVRWPANIADTLSQHDSLRLRYTDPEAPQDVREAAFSVVARAPFVLDPNAPDSEDTDRDFRFKTWEALFQGSPRPQAGETVTLLPGDYSGAWFIDTPGVRIEAQPGATLHGSLTLKADHIALSGLELESPEAVALNVKGNAISLEGVSVRAQYRAITVEGRAFVMENSRLVSQGAALTLNGTQTKITRNAIIGTPALVVGRVHSALEHNWWGSPNGPGEDVQVAQEDVFPWLLTPPVGSFEAADVEGTRWKRGHGFWDDGFEPERLSKLDFRDPQHALQQFFGQREVDLPVAEGWSVRVHTQRAGRAIVERKEGRSRVSFPPYTTTLGVWLEPTRGTTLTLNYGGARPPQAWIARGTSWVKLYLEALGQQRWRARLPRPLSGSSLPLWLALSRP